MQKTVAIVEDNNDIRTRFVDVFSSAADIVCIGAYANAEDFLSEYLHILPDVVFMDIQLPGMDGIECIKQLKAKNRNTHFIMYSVFENSESIFSAIKAGATGYLLKSTPSEKLVSSVHEILNGESPMTGTVAMKVIKAFQAPLPGSVAVLSERENTILANLSKGYRYKDIAEKLCISTETVRTHIRNIYEKLQVNSRTEAINKSRQLAGVAVEKYLNSNVKPGDEEACFHKINEVFKNKKPFLQEKFSITALSAETGFPVYVISQTINRRFNMGFFDLINKCRIEEALLLLKTEGGKITAEGIGYQCGFGSRTAFYNAFKKVTGATPGGMIADNRA